MILNITHGFAISMAIMYGAWNADPASTLPDTAAAANSQYMELENIWMIRPLSNAQRLRLNTMRRPKLNEITTRFVKTVKKKINMDILPITKLSKHECAEHFAETIEYECIELVQFLIANPILVGDDGAAKPGVIVFVTIGTSCKFNVFFIKARESKQYPKGTN